MRKTVVLNVVGLTAGTSTPDDVIDRVERQVRLCQGASNRRVSEPNARLVSAADPVCER